MARQSIFRAAPGRAGLVLLLSAALAAGGCSTMKGWFSGKNGKLLAPAELTEFTPTAKADRVWAVSAGDGEARVGSRQGPAVADGRVYASGTDGVGAWDLQTGKQVWYHEDKKDDDGNRLGLAGSPGAGDGLVVVGGLEGDVLALDAATGDVKWQAKVGTEVLAAPAIGQGLVLVRSIDGRVTAFDAASGERRWFWEKEAPALTVRGNGSPLLAPGAAFIGNDDGTISALTLSNGAQIWEQLVSTGEGRSELDRMADVDGTPVLDGTTIYATSYKGQTLSIDGPTGRPLWSHDAGGPGTVGLASDRIVVSDAKGTVWALAKTDGSALWQQPALARRNLTAAVVQGNYAVVGDIEGYLHWLNLQDGAFAARARAGSDPIRGQPVVADGLLIVETTGGELSAWRISP
ncbi:MAG: outer membrane protein assembly factor BamB [Luteimonas sp.]